MGKAIVFSILLATIVIPLVYARKKNKQRALGKAVVAFYVYCTIWVLATLFIAPHV
ncbi:MAG TPA: hypothetical protein VGH28_01735 [Polyangiaceae bacterium]|jgi:hypothetical protein